MEGIETFIALFEKPPGSAVQQEEKLQFLKEFLKFALNAPLFDAKLDPHKIWAEAMAAAKAGDYQTVSLRLLFFFFSSSCSFCLKLLLR